jgi:hypothetical protein
MKDLDEQAIRKYLDKLDPNAANRRTVGQRAPTIVAQQRRPASVKITSFL